MYRALDVPLVRAAAMPLGHDLPAWPDLNGADDAAAVPGWRAWLERVWGMPGFAAAVTVASPALAAQVRRITAGNLSNAREVRRAVLALLRYLLRATGRATPFGLFAGVAAARFGPTASVSWDQPSRPIFRAGSAWLSTMVDRAEADPARLARLTVVANDLAGERDGRLVLACQTGSGDGLVDVSVRMTGPVRAAVEHARTPIRFADLAGKLAAGWPHVPQAKVEALLADLVRRRLLVTDLRPPMTCADPVRHVTARLDSARTVPDVDDGGSTVVDLRLDLDLVVPHIVMRAAEAAARALTLLTAHPGGLPAWVAWHEAFLDRYGPGALVPVTEVTDPAVGLGLPATFRGADRTVADPGSLDRDRRLAALVQDAALHGEAEIVLDDAALAALSGPATFAAPPHVGVYVQVHAPDLDAIHQGRFTVEVTGAARAVGASEGRFLSLLDPARLEEFRATYANLPVLRAGAVPVQVSCAPLRPDVADVARAPLLLPAVLRLGEHPQPDDRDPVGLRDLAVGGDEHGLYLVDLRSGRLVEPTVLNSVELRYHSHPLVRFLCELPRARCAVYMPFSWGSLADLRYLPRLRYGRAVLAPARWRLPASDLPNRRADWITWRDSLDRWRRTYRVAPLVHLVEADNLLRLDLRVDAHANLLREHLNRRGVARLQEAPEVDAFGWIGGHVHEIVIPLASTATPHPAPDLGVSPTVRTVARDDGHLPGASAWLHANLYTNHEQRWTLLHDLADLLSTVNGVVGWWYLPYPSPRPHLRLRLRLADPGVFGDVARVVGGWADACRARGLLGRLQFDTYTPETGRYGHGEAMSAAETVFMADTTAALAQHRHATATGVPLAAVTVASLLDVATAYTGTDIDGMRWLVDRLPHEPVRADPAVRRAAQRIAAIGNSTIEDLPDGPAMRQAWVVRRHALAVYRERLAGQRDPLPVLGSLLHVHHVRVHGTDPDGERAGRHLARTIALSWLATRGTP